jgi:hypothetical protein
MSRINIVDCCLLHRRMNRDATKHAFKSRLAKLAEESKTCSSLLSSTSTPLMNDDNDINSNNYSNNCLNRLPDVLLSSIFQYLPSSPDVIGICYLVCRQWQNVVRLPSSCLHWHDFMEKLECVSTIVPKWLPNVRSLLFDNNIQHEINAMRVASHRHHTLLSNLCDLDGARLEILNIRGEVTPLQGKGTITLSKKVYSRWFPRLTQLRQLSAFHLERFDMSLLATHKRLQRLKVNHTVSHGEPLQSSLTIGISSSLMDIELSWTLRGGLADNEQQLFTFDLINSHQLRRLHLFGPFQISNWSTPRSTMRHLYIHIRSSRNHSGVASHGSIIATWLEALKCWHSLFEVVIDGAFDCDIGSIGDAAKSWKSLYLTGALVCIGTSSTLLFGFIHCILNMGGVGEQIKHEYVMSLLENCTSLHRLSLPVPTTMQWLPALAAAKGPDHIDDDTTSFVIPPTVRIIHIDPLADWKMFKAAPPESSPTGSASSSQKAWLCRKADRSYVIRAYRDGAMMSREGDKAATINIPIHIHDSRLEAIVCIKGLSITCGSFRGDTTTYTDHDNQLMSILDVTVRNDHGSRMRAYIMDLTLPPYDLTTKDTWSINTLPLSVRRALRSNVLPS